MAKKPSQTEAPVANFDHPASSFERFLEENLKSLLIAGAVIFVGIMGYLVFNYLSETEAAEEANAFTSAETVEAYREVISSYPSSLAAGNAQLMIAKSLSDSEDTRQEAISELRTFVESYADHPRRAQGIFELGSLLMSDGNRSGAITQFDQLISEYPDSHLTPYAKLCKGDFSYEDRDTDEAQKIYSDVLTSHSGTQAAQLAEQRIDRAKIDPPVIVAPRPEETIADPDAGAPAAPAIPEPPPLLADPNQDDDSDTEEAGDPDAEKDAATDAPPEEGGGEGDATAGEDAGKE